MDIINKNAINQFNQATISDDIFFCKIMSEKKFALPLLQRILPDLHITDLKEPISQFTIKDNPQEHVVRFDVYSESEGRYFDLEMQTTKNPALDKRIRYYQSKMDSNLLKKGKDYSKLPPIYIIFICTFDPFNLGSYRYEFSGMYDLLNHVKLNTESHVIMLNAYGENPDSINPGLLNFLNLIAGNDVTKDKYVENIKDEIRYLKDNMQWRMIYMQEYNSIAVRERKEGRLEAINMAIPSFIDSMKEDNYTDEQIIDRLIRVFKLDIKEAKQYLKQSNK